MSDTVNRRVPADPSKVRLGEAWEQEFWTTELKASPAIIRRAIQKVGDNVSEVRSQLNSRVRTSRS
jgi:hypothetical protein